MVIDKRKGDVTISTVILIVLGLVVLVMLILGFTRGFDTIFGIFDRAPSELQTLAEACVVYAQGNLLIDFCTYREVGDEYVNCLDSRIKPTLDEKSSNYPTSCSNTNGQSICNSLPANARNSTVFNSGVGFNCTSA